MCVAGGMFLAEHISSYVYYVMGRIRITWTDSDSGILFAKVRTVIVGDVRDCDGAWMASVMMEGYRWEIKTFDDMKDATAFVEEGARASVDYIRSSLIDRNSKKNPRRPA